MTDEELIQQYLEKNQVTKVPRGVSGLPEMKWVPGSDKGNGGRIMELGPDGKPLSKQDYINKIKRSNKKNIAVAKRRGRVRELAHDHTIGEIADALGMAYRTVKDDLRAMQIPAFTRSRKGLLICNASKEARAKVLAAIDAGCKTAYAVQHHAGISWKTADSHLKAIRNDR